MGKVLTLGEGMLRFSTTTGTRLSNTETVSLHYGGGEANVAISLANYGHDASFASKVPNNSLGDGFKNHLQHFKVKTDALLRGGERLGTYYVEGGVGERGAKVIYDRAYSSFARIIENEWDSAQLFKDIELFHISGITPALSSNWRHLTRELLQQAKKAGCKISFDVNYRAKLWTQEEASEMLTEVLPLVDYCSLGKLDALYLLGIPPYQGGGEELAHYYSEIQKRYPNIQVLYATKREVLSANFNKITGAYWQNGQYYESKKYEIRSIVDRIGGGDAFSGGVLHGIIEHKTPQEIIDFATAAAVLKHTIYGDCNQFSEQEVHEFMTAESGKIMR